MGAESRVQRGVTPLISVDQQADEFLLGLLFSGACLPGCRPPLRRCSAAAQQPTFDHLAERLRQSIAQAIGETVADAVQHATHTILRSPLPGPDPPHAEDWPSRQAMPRHEQRRELFWADGLEELPDETELADPFDEDADEYAADDRSIRQARSSPTPSKPPSRWQQALIAGCEATAWCQRMRQSSPLVALSVGLISAAAAWVAGPTLAGSTRALLGLMQTVQASAIALGRAAI